MRQLMSLERSRQRAIDALRSSDDVRSQPELDNSEALKQYTLRRW